ncbi:MAG: FHA domain-containing protein [Burkholderiales bacterium]|nr:FHA domain-containing protein [Burkholderiales bacterium]
MAKLILSMDGLVLKEITLTKERTTIGRKPHNDIQIDNLAVSGEHAVIVTILNDSFLEDLGSTNGTLVNGQPIKKHFLQNSDVIELGKYKLKYLSDTPAAAKGPQDFEKTMVIRPGGMPKPGAAQPAGPGASQPASTMSTSQGMPSMNTSQGMPTLGAPHGKPAPAMPAPGASQAAPSIGTSQPQPTMASSQPMAAGRVAAIQILSGANAGKEMELTKALTTLGKPGVQVAVITRRPQGYFITHVEGASFPIVNGKTLDAQAHALSDHDVLELAGVKMEFFFKG